MTAATTLEKEDDFNLDIFPSTPEQQQELPPTKKVRYDKLGREILNDSAAATAAAPSPPSTAMAKPPPPAATTTKTTVLKRPRGRTPKGKIWDDKRGYVNEGLRGFN